MASFGIGLPDESVSVPFNCSSARKKLFATTFVSGAWTVRRINPRVVDELSGPAASIGKTVVAARTELVRAARTITQTLNVIRREEVFMAISGVTLVWRELLRPLPPLSTA